MKKYYILILLLILNNMLFSQSGIKYSDFHNACSDILKQKLFELDFKTPSQNEFKSEKSTIIFSPERTIIKIADKKDYNTLKSKLSDSCKQIDFIWNEDIKSYETIYKCSNHSIKSIKSSIKVKTYKLTQQDFIYIFEIKCNNLNKIINIDPKLNLDLNR